VWIAENLAYLPAVHPSSSESYTEPRYYVYGYEGTDVAAAKQKANYTTYGVLYNWPAALTACPSGWQLPTDNEWKQLEMAIGMSQSEADDTDDTGYRGTNEGTKLKATSGWNSKGNGTDDFGFSALPGGGRNYDGGFDDVGYGGNWWSSTEYYTDNPWSRHLYDFDTRVYRYAFSKDYGFSVRCVRD